MATLDFTRYGLSRTEIVDLINEWVLNERDRKIMMRRHIDGICFEPLAEEFELSVRGTKNIVYRHDARLEDILKRRNG